MADCPRTPGGPSMRPRWTVRLVLADSPPGPVLSCYAFRPLSIAFASGSFGVAPRVGRSAVTTLPWQTYVGILGCEIGA
jgi:hypothetical protein